MDFTLAPSRFSSASSLVSRKKSVIFDFYTALADINTQINYSRHFTQKAEDRVHHLLAKIEGEKLS